MITSPWDRIACIDRTRLDAIAASVIAVALELELRDQTTNRLATVVAAALFAAPVAVRRRWPLGAVVASSLVAVIQAPLGGHLTAANGIILPALLLGYGAGAWLGPPPRPRRRHDRKQRLRRADADHSGSGLDVGSGG